MLKEAGDDLCQAAAVAVYNTSILTFVYIFNYLFTIDQYFMISEYSTLGDANVSTFFNRVQVETLGDILWSHSTVLRMLKG